MSAPTPGRVRLMSVREAHAKVESLHLKRFRAGRHAKLLAGAGGRGPVLLWRVKGGFDGHPHHAEVARALAIDPRQFVAGIVDRHGKFFLHRSDGLFAPAPHDPRAVVASIEAAHPELTWSGETVGERKRRRALHEVSKVDLTLMLRDGGSSGQGARL